MFDEYWVEDHTPMARQAVEHAWAIACDEPLGDMDLRQCHAELLDFVEYYHDESIGILANSVKVALRIVQAITAVVEEDAALAVA
ncbi:MAG TPA: hypothetical protein ENK57_02085, partial [Polyangiaceae bacterium]|nr:hypothetical protein [Polyangiaceae bacterium]